MLIVMLLNIFLFPSMMDRTQQVRFDQFSDQLKEDNVDEVYVTTNNEIVYTLKMTIKHSVECHLQNRRDSGCQPVTCWMVRT